MAQYCGQLVMSQMPGNLPSATWLTSITSGPGWWREGVVTALGGQADTEGQHSLEVTGRADGQQLRIIRREHRGSGIGLVRRLRADRARAVEDHPQVGLASQCDAGRGQGPTTRFPRLWSRPAVCPSAGTRWGR